MADTEALVNQLDECAAKQDFEGAFRLARENQVELSKKLRPTGVWPGIYIKNGKKIIIQ